MRKPRVKIILSKYVTGVHIFAEDKDCFEITIPEGAVIEKAK